MALRQNFPLHFVLLITAAGGCGGIDVRDRIPSEDKLRHPGPGDLEQVRPGVVKGRWEIPIVGDEDLRPPLFFNYAMGNSSSSQAMTGTVAAAVTFSLSHTSFAHPGSTNGIESYGTLDITALKDNTLRVCGAQQNQKCTKAVLRIYTSGTAGDGLWSTVEALGLPITSGASVIRLGSGNAAVLSTVSIVNNTTIKLSDFAATGSYKIPISVDFTDAAAGAYSTTLVVEYLTQ